jgi:transcriptional regulator with XRE-family HTH domain
MNKHDESELPLTAFGTLVRETRVRKHLTQDRAAKGAGVSRKQWALLEQGHNASASFIKKVAKYLELTVIPLGEGLHASTEAGRGVNVGALFALADEITSVASGFADRLRTFAVEAVLPASERSRDADAIDAFITRTNVPDERSRPLTRAIHNLAADLDAVRPAPQRNTERITKRRRRTG